MILNPEIITSTTRKYNEHLDLVEWNGIRMSGDPEGVGYLVERKNLTSAIPDTELIAMRRHEINSDHHISYLYGAEWIAYRGTTFTFDLQLRIL